MDVLAFGNSDTSKRRCRVDVPQGRRYVPVFAYPGEEGYAVYEELRPGSTHGVHEMPTLLVRMHAVRGSHDNLVVLEEAGCAFVVKLPTPAEDRGRFASDSPRERVIVGAYQAELSRVPGKVGYVDQVPEVWATPQKQPLFAGKIHVAALGTSLSHLPEEVLAVCRERGNIEPFPREVKTDLDKRRDRPSPVP